MPVGRRKVAFSGKKKKEQMQARKARKLHTPHGEDKDEPYQGPAFVTTAKQDAGINYKEEILAINHQPGVNIRVNRYNLKFRKETQEQKEIRRARNNVAVQILPKTELEVSSVNFYPPGLGYPSRPHWKADMSKRELDMSENRHFRLFCEQIDKDFSKSELSMYELNLETWRQLWRVTEMSDILLIIVDARFPVSQFPPYLYRHLVEKENKGIILILNKCDLLPPSVILAWEHYFAQNFPKLIMVPFSSLEGRKTKKNLLKLAAESSLCLVDACQRLVDDKVNLQFWRRKIEEEREIINEDSPVDIETNIVASQSTTPEIYQRFKDGVLTIGTIGHPNVGKSSLINALMGKKVVSVSKTPGHTKHFQTIFLTKNIKLCDCPGLVFPSTVEMPLQVLLGSFPISQVRDPISVVNYIASRLNIPHILKLKMPDDEMEESEWTSYLICQAWAEKRGYHIRSRGADVSRAANELLRLCLNGQKNLIIYQRPPGYTNDKGKFESDSKIKRIELIQGYHAKQAEEESEDEEGNETKLAENAHLPSEDEEDGSDTADSEPEETNSEDDDNVSLLVTSVQNKFDLLPDED